MNRVIFLALCMCAGSVALAQPVPFRRGDANGADGIDLSDAVFVLNFLFVGGASPSCLDAADTDDSGKVDISDGIYLLNFLFLGGPAPPTPFASCGLDTTDDALDCASYSGCAGEIAGFTFIGENEQGYPEYRHDRLLDDYGVEMVFVLLPGGDFFMGSPEEECGHFFHETLHEVRLSPFLIAKHEVS